MIACVSALQTPASMLRRSDTSMPTVDARERPDGIRRHVCRFRDQVKQIPVSSTKSMIGHTLSAAGTIEAAFS
jgi:3-oxoacyl-(acyl-carrier-protein) synthase